MTPKDQIIFDRLMGREKPALVRALMRYQKDNVFLRRCVDDLQKTSREIPEFLKGLKGMRR